MSLIAMRRTHAGNCHKDVPYESRIADINVRQHTHSTIELLTYVVTQGGICSARQA
jgi:hypothetical protein